MKSSLGRGLQSLIPKKKPREIEVKKKTFGKIILPKEKKESVFNIEIDKIRPNSSQPRQEFPLDSLKELSESIKEHGIIQPLVVTKIEKANERGRQVEYELVAGERRWRAAKMAGLPSVPVIIRNTSSDEKLQIALVENIQRENLNAIDLALAYKQLAEKFKLTHAQIAQKVGKDRSTVTNTLRLLVLPLRIQQAVSLGEINEGHARAIMTARPEYHMRIMRQIVKNNLNVRQVEDIARKVADEFKPKAKAARNPLFRKMEKDLSKIWGHRISICQRRDLGRLAIEFSNKEELDKLVNYLSKI